MLLFKNNVFHVIVPGQGLGEIVEPKAGDVIDVYASEAGMEAALGKLHLRVKGNRVEEIVKVLPPIRHEARYQRKNANKPNNPR